MKLLSRIGAAFTVLRSGIPAAWFDRVLPLGAYNGDCVSEPYKESVWVMRAIKEIAGPISAVELKFYEGDAEITTAPWLEFWKKPARNLTLADFIEALVGWLKLAGEDFIILQPEFTVPFPEVAGSRNYPPLILARPEYMRAVIENNELIGWEYRGAKGQVLKLAPDQVIHPMFWNPYDEWRGMSEYESARIATEADYLAGKFALNLSRANGDTGVMVTLKNGGQLQDGQQKQIEDMLRLKQQKSLRGQFSSVFIPADMEVQDPKVRAPDAGFMAQRLGNRHEIYIAFGVPPSMADIAASYSIGSASDWYRLITGTCMPTAAKLEDAISQIASRQHGRPVTAYFEWDEHPVMQAVRSERIDAWTKLVDRGMPGEIASETLDLDLPEYPAGKVGLIPFSLAPFGEATAPQNQPQNDPSLAEPDMVGAALHSIRQAKLAIGNRKSQINDCPHCTFDLSDLAIRANDSADVRKWKTLVAKRRATMRAYESKFNRVLMLARAEVLRKLEAHSNLKSQPSGLIGKAAAADFLFNLGDFTNAFQAQMRASGLNALQVAGEQLFEEVGKDDPWSMPPAKAIEFIKARENRLAGVPGDVFERIKGVIEDGLNAGDPLKQIASAVRGEFNDISDGRAKVIASTETAAAYGTARQAAMEEAGIQWKQWLTSGNANVRAAHRLMNGATVPIDADFTVINPVTGESDTVKHPADPTGAPWNVINCHCVEIAVASGPEENNA